MIRARGPGGKKSGECGREEPPGQSLLDAHPADRHVEPAIDDVEAVCFTRWWRVVGPCDGEDEDDLMPRSAIMFEEVFADLQKLRLDDPPAKFFLELPGDRYFGALHEFDAAAGWPAPDQLAIPTAHFHQQNVTIVHA